MDSLTKEKKEEIIRTLSERGVKGLCPMCGNNHFVVADGYFNTAIQNDFKTLNLGGPSIPTISIICSRCGFVSQHALGVLGLLPKLEEKKNEK
jgi:hypothetical protein